MILTILRISLIGLARDRVALALTFVMPIAFFSIFASAFSGMDADGLRSVRALVVADPQSSFAARLADRLVDEPALDVEILLPRERERALEEVRRGRATVAVILPSVPGPEIELHADRSNPLAGGLVQGLVLRAAAPDGVVLPVRVIDALGRTGKRPSVAFFAAGLGVMFLMFAVTGRSAILIEERERGVLGRLLTTRVGMTRLLIGRWLFLAIVGTAQVVVMFVWAALVFGLDLFNTRSLVGFLGVTSVTALTAAAFALALSTACRTRAQLNGVGAIVILGLSAIGGNLFPSFLMPDTLRAIGSWTFNAWALGAYQKIFWYERPFLDVLPETAALATAAVFFFGVARLLAGRWQRAGALP